MLPDTFFQVMSITADLVLFLFVGHYVLRLHAKEQEIEKKEKKIDTDYHQIVDDALTKERKILDDATAEADKIIAETHTVTEGSKDAIDQALDTMQSDIRQEVEGMAHNFRDRYQDALHDLTDASLKDFKSVTKELEDGLRKQVNDFQTAMLPGLQKELDDYKAAKMKETDQMTQRIIQRVSQEVLNKAISLDDHQQILIDSLEKAKREGIFN